jgi:hypothetical protein
MPKFRTRGKFWPQVRAVIWEKAQELYQMENAKTMKDDFKGATATRKELRKGGYFQTAKLIILRELWLQKKAYPQSKKKLKAKLSKQYKQCSKF